MNNAPESYAFLYAIVATISFFTLVFFDFRKRPALRLGDVLCALAAILWPVSALMWVVLFCCDAMMDMVRRK